MGPMTNHTILIAEDDQGIQEVIRTILEDNGHTTISADNKRDIFSAAQEKNPSLIFLDISLSGEDGVVIARELKKTSATKDIPIIMMSAHSDMLKKVQDVPIQGVLRKPFDIGDLLFLVQKHLQ